MLLIGAGSLLMMLVASTSGWVVLLPGLVVSGLGVGLATPVLVSAVLATVHGHRAGIAGGAVTTFRQLGMAVGIAVLGTVVAGRIADVVAGGAVQRRGGAGPRRGSRPQPRGSHGSGAPGVRVRAGRGVPGLRGERAGVRGARPGRRPRQPGGRRAARADAGGDRRALNDPTRNDPSRERQTPGLGP